ncbi:thiosulfate oxidation carrier complex protein SoxZ [Hydrogenophilus thermoluteolus]|uniref:thiosulfate oxidation carrier complex protein SoxZ n=1 Tax=Hydrogenophilus thermoluteolus TaxID=297 RepID=UPI0024A34A97|nr:thiosulfate oxidation carrier complex protein SoxZ [Hydrogenophilus thermoluteolus]GLW60121.1 thiosulfate oxidation carrier complex protein SoxZ [Hydrogenophilus thermoluteolus]
MSGPMRIRAQVNGDEVNVRALMAHPMETGLRKDTSGNTIPAHYITEVIASVNGKTVLTAEWSGAISTNPYFEFDVKAKKGDKITLKWIDNKGESKEETVEVK